MARSCVLTADDSTPESGQKVTITATFTNDDAAVTVSSIESLVAIGQAGFFDQMKQKLVGQTIAAADGMTPVDTAIDFPVVLFSGQKAPFTVAIDLAAVLSDGTVVDATGVTLTVSPPTLLS